MKKIGIPVLLLLAVLLCFAGVAVASADDVQWSPNVTLAENFGYDETSGTYYVYVNNGEIVIPFDALVKTGQFLSAFQVKASLIGSGIDVGVSGKDGWISAVEKNEIASTAGSYPVTELQTGVVSVKIADPSSLVVGTTYTVHLALEESVGPVMSEEFAEVVYDTVDVAFEAREKSENYTVVLHDYVYGNAPVSSVEPGIIPAVPSASEVTYYYSFSENGDGYLWSQEEGNKLNALAKTALDKGVNPYYIYAKINDGTSEIVTERSKFLVLKAEGIVPRTVSIDVSNMPVVVVLNPLDAGRDMEYSIDGGSTWTKLYKAEVEAGLFSLPGLQQKTQYTLMLRACETTNYKESEPLVQTFRTPDLTPVYKVKYNANGGMNTPDDISVKEGELLDIDEGYSVYYAGYDFNGWWTSPVGGEQYSGTITVTENLTLYAHWVEQPFTVKFNANGGTGDMDSITATVSEDVTLPKNTFVNGSHPFFGWAVSENANVFCGDEATIKLAPGDLLDNSLTLYAVWGDASYSISGEITGEDGTRVQVTLMYGNIMVSESDWITITGGKVTVAFDNVPGGTYNVVVETDDGRVITQIINVAGSGPQFSLEIPDSGVNSKVEVKEKTAQAVVGELDKEAEEHREEGKTVTLLMTVEAREEKENYEGGSKEEKVQNDIQDIKKEVLSEGKTNLEYVTLDVKKETKIGGIPAGSQTISVTSKVLEIIIPFDCSDKNDVTVYRKHGDEVEELTKSSSKAEGTYQVDRTNNLVKIYAQKFSLYAFGWTDSSVEKHTISYDANGGTGSMDPVILLDEGWIVLPLSAFTPPAGKVFASWIVGDPDTGTVMYPGDTLTPADDITKVYAKWVETVFWTVSFDANGGTGSMDPVEVRNGNSMKLPACTFTAPAKQEFAGWLVNGSFMQPGDIFYPTSDTVAVAQWKDIGKWMVSFDANGGTGEMHPVYVTKGESVTLPACEFIPPEDMEFAGWQVNSSILQPGETFTPIGNTVVYALWKDTGKWMVAFDKNGGTGVMQPVYVSKGESIRLPYSQFTAPSGKEFSCWMIDGRYYNAGEMFTPASNVTAYAVWKSTGGGGGDSSGGSHHVITMYLVEFNSCGGSLVPDQLVKENSLVVEPEDPTKEGYVFTGWYTEKGVRWNFATDKVTSSMILYAHWNMFADSCLVTFDTGGKSVNPPPQVLAVGSTVMKPADPQAGWLCFPSWWIFEGWTTEDGKMWNFSTDIVTEDTTLYAQWLFPWWWIVLAVLFVAGIVVLIVALVRREKKLKKVKGKEDKE